MKLQIDLNRAMLAWNCFGVGIVVGLLIAMAGHC